ncbi:MAG: hypothetical protein ACTHN5_11345 [Phycisphaerae bacterium]
MFTTLIAHGKALALAGTLACGGAFGTHAAYTHYHHDRTPVRYEQRNDRNEQRFDRDDRRPAQTDRFDNHRAPDFHLDRDRR